MQKPGACSGEKIDGTKLNQMLNRFYELEGWDVAKGLQTRHGLTKLSLEDVAERIRQVGRLVE